MKGYKFIKENMKSREGNHTWEVGEWYKEEEIKLCEKGFHACKTPLQSLDFVYGDKWFIVEARGKILHEKDVKFVSQEMRLVKEININKVVKRFAIFCAKQCLSNYEKEYPDDKRPFEAIKAAEDYLDNKIDLTELNIKLSAARSAARSAESAAWSAAWSAARSAESAAWSAARSAESAARSAESAAWSAAWSAARSAESGAWSAAYSAAESARSAARFAAWSAAWSAAVKSQNKELLRLIKLDLAGKL